MKKKKNKQTESESDKQNREYDNQPSTRYTYSYLYHKAEIRRDSMAAALTAIAARKCVTRSLLDSAKFPLVRLVSSASSSASSSSSSSAAESAMKLSDQDFNFNERDTNYLPQRLLMSTGPSNTHPRALAAQSIVQVGHMHDVFYPLLDDIKGQLNTLFRTKSPYTLAISGGGHSAMETMVANLMEENDKMLVCVNGIWGERIVEIGKRLGVNVITTKVPLGKSFSATQIESVISTHKPKAVFMTHGESCTGVVQSLDGMSDICRKHGALLLVDGVCTLGGIPFMADEMGVDVMYAGSQKCLSAPPGASPMFWSERAMDVVKSRKTLPRTYNYDIEELGNYWGWFGNDKRSYHHTPPIGTFYALREALAITHEEGLERVWKRHKDLQKMLWDGLDSLGLEPYVEKESDRLVTVNTIKIPENVDWKKVCEHAMTNYNLEIGGGLGPTVGKVWRIGIMGYNARPENIALTINAFRDGLKAAMK